MLQRDGFLDAFAISTGGVLSVQLWRAQPELRTIRPPSPGALITSADCLCDGRVALAVQVPPTGERQAWAYDPIAAAVERLGHAAADLSKQQDHVVCIQRADDILRARQRGAIGFLPTVEHLALGKRAPPRRCAVRARRASGGPNLHQKGMAR